MAGIESNRTEHQKSLSLDHQHHHRYELTDCSFRYASFTSLRQRHSSLCISDLPFPAPTTSSPFICSQCSRSTTPLLFHSRLKTHFIHKFSHHRLHTADFITCTRPFLLSILFIDSYFYSLLLFFGAVRLLGAKI